jgi:hypothetical protein
MFIAIRVAVLRLPVLLGGLRAEIGVGLRAWHVIIARPGLMSRVVITEVVSVLIHSVPATSECILASGFSISYTEYIFDTCGTTDILVSPRVTAKYGKLSCTCCNTECQVGL